MIVQCFLHLHKRYILYNRHLNEHKQLHYYEYLSNCEKYSNQECTYSWIIAVEDITRNICLLMRSYIIANIRISTTSRVLDRPTMPPCWFNNEKIKSSFKVIITFDKLNYYYYISQFSVVIYCFACSPCLFK